MLVCDIHTFYGKSLKTTHVHHMTTDSWVVEWRIETWSLPCLSFQHPAAADPTMPFFGSYLSCTSLLRPTCLLCECIFRVRVVTCSLGGKKKGEYDQNVMVLSCVCIGRESFDHVIPRELSLGFSHTLDPKAGIVLSLSLSVNANDDSGLMIFMHV